MKTKFFIVSLLGIVVLILANALAAVETDETQIINQTSNQEVLVKYAKTAPDPAIRILALKKVLDQRVIAEVAQKDSNKTVREDAVLLLKSHHALIKCLKDQEEGVRHRALERISDRLILEDVFYDRFVWTDTRLLALQRMKVSVNLRDIDDLLANASQNPELSVGIIDLISDQKELYRIAGDNWKLEVTIAAIDRLVDPAYLKKLLKTFKNPLLQRIIGLGLADQSELKRTFIEEIDRTLRLSALKRINDQAFLANIAKSHRDEKVRLKSIDLSEDEVMLKSLAEGDKSTAARIRALNKISDQLFLKNIALSERDWLIRRAAVERLTDPATLQEIAGRDPEWPVAVAAICGMGPEELFEFVNKTNDFDLRGMAVARIKDQSLLNRIAREASDWRVRIKAIKELINGAVINEIVTHDTDRRVAEEFAKTPFLIYGVLIDKQGNPLRGIGVQAVIAKGSGQQVIFEDPERESGINVLDTESNQRGEFTITIPPDVPNLFGNKFSLMAGKKGWKPGFLKQSKETIVLVLEEIQKSFDLGRITLELK